MVLVSAVANPSRLVTVHNSLQRFAPSSWDCTVCTWNNDVHELLQRASSASDKLNAGRELAGPAVARAARYVARRCAIVYRRNYKWASLLNATRHTGASHEFTFVLLDDIELPRSSFDAERMLDLARRRRLDVLSPLVRGGSHNFMNPSEAFQRQVKEHGTELRLQLVIEAYATLFTSAAWGCFSSMFVDDVLHTESEAIGYGYDFCFHAHCSGRPHIFGRQALALKQLALHLDAAWKCRWGGCDNHSTNTSPGRRLGLGSNYNLTDLGMLQVKKLHSWVWRHDRNRCADISPRPKGNIGWFAFE